MYRGCHGNFLLFLPDFDFYSNLTTEVIKNPHSWNLMKELKMKVVNFQGRTSRQINRYE
jgi:hypothetical protein